LVKFKLQRLRDTFHLRQDRLVDRIRRIQQYPYVHQVRQDLLEQFEPLCSEFRIEKRQSGHIAARPREVGHDT
jgi:hypothetical protein